MASTTVFTAWLVDQFPIRFRAQWRILKVSAELNARPCCHRSILCRFVQVNVVQFCCDVILGTGQKVHAENYLVKQGQNELTIFYSWQTISKVNLCQTNCGTCLLMASTTVLAAWLVALPNPLFAFSGEFLKFPPNWTPGLAAGGAALAALFKLKSFNFAVMCDFAPGKVNGVVL